MPNGYLAQSSAIDRIDDAYKEGKISIDSDELKRSGAENSDYYMSSVKNMVPNDRGESSVERERRWDYIEKNYGDQQFMREHNVIKNATEKFNTELKTEFETTPSFFRGSGKDELDSYKESGTIGGDKNKYNYVAVTTNPASAGAFGRGVMIEYDGDSIREHGTLVEYSPRPQPVGTSTSLNPESIGKPMSFRYGNEKEVRLPEGLKLDNVGIKNIHIDSFYNKNRDEISSKYGSLGNIVYHDNYDDWIFSFGGKK